MQRSRALWFVYALPVLCCVSAVLLAQETSGPRFEVASVKENKSGNLGGQMGFAAGGRFNATNTPLVGVLSIALISARPPLARYRLVGAPDWINSVRYDIVAKTEGEYQPGTDVPLLRNLLIDRFNLVTHTETRQLPVYELVRPMATSTFGPQLLRSSVDCDVVNGRSGLPGTPNPAASNCNARSGFGRITGKAITMRQLAGNLSTWVDGIVVDNTMLDGVFDVDLKFTPDQIPGGAAPPSDMGPSVFTAVQEQLGLKLQPTKAPVEVVVIDHIERPTED